MSRSVEEGPKGPIFSGRLRADRRARAARLGAPHLVPLALVVGAGLFLWWHRSALSGLSLRVAAAGPETQVKEALAHQGRAALDDVYGFRAGGTADLSRVGFADVAVSMEGERARVLAVVEAQGTVEWRSEKALLGYLGREAFGMTPCDIALWCGDGEQFARLRGVLTALFRREDAAGAGDVEATRRLVSESYAGPGGKRALLVRLARDYHSPPAEAHVTAWQIRVERDRAEVGEDAEFRLPSGARERRRALYTLVLEDGRWRFVDGL
ncbi:MAG TPA: nuclear transport factor 2 family protein [Anaeromyxobacter sp.]|nr:nuclear transport factor 2 family protein [Anaeromyxobacter sp.]